LDGNLQLSGVAQTINTTTLTLETNIVRLNANIAAKTEEDGLLGETPDAGFVVEHHNSSVPHGYFLFNHVGSDKERFWDLSGDSLTGNVLEATTLRANVIQSNGAQNLTITPNVMAPLFIGDLSGTTANLLTNVTAPLFNGNLSGTIANLTDNVTAPSFLGALTGNESDLQGIKLFKTIGEQNERIRYLAGYPTANVEINELRNTLVPTVGQIVDLLNYLGVHMNGNQTNLASRY
jgi:hypothetical protein